MFHLDKSLSRLHFQLLNKSLIHKFYIFNFNKLNNFHILQECSCFIQVNNRLICMQYNSMNHCNLGNYSVHISGKYCCKHNILVHNLEHNFFTSKKFHLHKINNQLYYKLGMGIDIIHKSYSQPH